MTDGGERPVAREERPVAREERRSGSVGLREVLLVSAAAVAVVLGAAALTGLLPTDLQRLVFHTPVAIALLVIGTAVVLWRVAAHRPPDP